MKYLIIILTALFITSCSNVTHLMTGQKRSPTKVSTVKIYHKTPSAHYSEIAVLRTASRAGFTNQYRQDLGIERLREHAAELGANALIITDVNVTGATIGTDEVAIQGIAVYMP